jgi:hypothetical protein
MSAMRTPALFAGAPGRMLAVLEVHVIKREFSL